MEFVNLYKPSNDYKVFGYEHWGFTSKKELINQNRLSEDNYEIVKTTTLEELKLLFGQPQLLKGDIEGAEEELVDIDLEIINNSSFVQGELHSDKYKNVENASKSPSKITAKLYVIVFEENWEVSKNPLI